MILTYMVIGEVNYMQTMPALLFSTKNYEVASDCACMRLPFVYILKAGRDLGMRLLLYKSITCTKEIRSQHT